MVSRPPDMSRQYVATCGMMDSNHAFVSLVCRKVSLSVMGSTAQFVDIASLLCNLEGAPPRLETPDHVNDPTGTPTSGWRPATPDSTRPRVRKLVHETRCPAPGWNLTPLLSNHFQASDTRSR